MAEKKAGIKLTADMSLLLKEIREAKDEFRKFNKDAVGSVSGLKRIESQASQTGRSLRGFSKVLADIKGGLSGVFGQFTLAGVASNAISGAIFRVQGLLTGLVRGSIEASSALTELDSKARVVFGDTFDIVAKQSRAIADEVGRANSAVLSFATDIGAIFEANGIGGRALGDMSTQIAKLAVDLASFNNTADEEAFQALQSGLVGMVQPLRRFGVDLTQTSLKQFALKKGIDESVESMNQAQLMALRYAFILETTTTAQGDAARTADSFANQVRRLEGEWQTLNEELGKTATPALAEGLGVLSKALQNVRYFVRALSEDVRALVGLFSSIPGIDRLKEVASNFPGSQLLSSTRGLKNIVGNRISSRFDEFRAGEDPGTETDPLSLISQLAGAGGETDKAAAQKAINDMMKAYGEAAKKNKQRLDQERERLKLRKEMGVATEKEERMLERINNRIDFASDKIADATKEWREQVQALEAVEDKIKDINRQIQEEQDRLKNTLADIDKERDEQRENTIADLLDEKKALEDRLRLLQGLDQEQQERLAELESILGRARKETPDLFGKGKEFSDADELEKIDIQTERRKEAAQEESDLRISGLEDELSQAERNKREIERMEQEKKQAVIDALNDRKARTFQAYAELEERLTEHVDKQVAELARYKAAVFELVSLELSAYYGFTDKAQQAVFEQAKADATNAFGRSAISRRARGGMIYGPGGPTSDVIPALLSNGEFVVNAAATSMFRPLLEKINNMSAPIQKFASGGEVSSTTNKNVKINITNNGRAAEVFADPRRTRWLARTYL